MAEVMATISLVSNITQFITLGSLVVKRVNEFRNSVNDFPKVFRDIKTELPLLLDTLQRTKEQAELGKVTDDTQRALLPVVNGCSDQVNLLNDMMNKVLASSKDSSWQRSRKAFTRQVSSLSALMKLALILLALVSYSLRTYLRARTSLHMIAER